MINDYVIVAELSLSYTIALEVLRCDCKSSVSRMCMMHAQFNLSKLGFPDMLVK